jgi:hypothetical protein
MAVLLLFFVLLLPLPAEDGAQLVVRVRDERGAGVAGILVTAHASDDQAVMGQAHTDTMGQAVFPNIAAPRVHILLTGTTAMGVPLRLQGHDAEGITLHLNGADTSLALRVERNGIVIVDPTSWAQEPVSNATNSVAVTATPASAEATPLAEPLAVQSPSAQPTLPLVLLFALLGLVAVLVLRARRVS